MTDEAKHFEETVFRGRNGSSSFTRSAKPDRKVLQPSLTVVRTELTNKQRRLRIQDKAELARLIDKLVAKRIRAYRLDRGITQQTLAEEVGVASQQIHKYESGISRISAGRLLQIAEALNFSVSDFFHFNGTAARRGMASSEKSTR